MGDRKGKVTSEDWRLERKGDIGGLVTGGERRQGREGDRREKVTSEDW